MLVLLMNAAYFRSDLNGAKSEAIKCENCRLQLDIGSTKMQPLQSQSKELSEDNNSNPKHSNGKSNSYAETFEFMLDILVYIVFSDRGITWRDIQENVTDRHKQSLIRQLKALKDLGFLDDGGIPTKRIQKYYATEKSKQLFGHIQSDKK